MEIELRDKRSAKQILNFPEELLQDRLLHQAVSFLPSHYNFEIYKTVHRIRSVAKRLGTKPFVCLQFPEGLMLYACIISDILTHFGPAETLIMGDLTYGACCIDDIQAHLLGADLIVHYGHSCLVPVSESLVQVLYVFVEVEFSQQHLLATISRNFKQKPLHLLGTIQFGTALAAVKEELSKKGSSVSTPQQKPRSPGEVLGCTSPLLPQGSTVLFVADGRFHLESVMIRNPTCQFFQYNPYSGMLTRQEYDYPRMRRERAEQVRRVPPNARVCIVFGTLGRQASILLLDRMVKALPLGWVHSVILASEFDLKLVERLGSSFDLFVQTCCPRMSIDWLYGAHRPVLNSYEYFVAVGQLAFGQEYPMDYYSKEGGIWTNNHGKKKTKIKKEKQPGDT